MILEKNIMDFWRIFEDILFLNCYIIIIKQKNGITITFLSIEISLV